MEKQKFYLEINDSRKGLLVSLESETVSTCSFSIRNAKSFQTRFQAKKFIRENNIQGQFKVISI